MKTEYNEPEQLLSNPPSEEKGLSEEQQKLINSIIETHDNEEERDALLWDAINTPSEHNNDEMIKALFTNLSVNGKNKNIGSILERYAMGNYNLIGFFLHSNADRDSINSAANNILHRSIIRNNHTVVKHLLREGVDPNGIVDGNIPLVTALAYINPYYGTIIAKLLLEAKADVNAINRNENFEGTALSIASRLLSFNVSRNAPLGMRNCYLEFICELLQRDATLHQDDLNKTTGLLVLRFATEKGFTKAAETLTQEGFAIPEERNFNLRGLRRGELDPAFKSNQTPPPITEKATAETLRKQFKEERKVPDRF
jgi:hypothetical protein